MKKNSTVKVSQKPKAPVETDSYARFQQWLSDQGKNLKDAGSKVVKNVKNVTPTNGLSKAKDVGSGVVKYVKANPIKSTLGGITGGLMISEMGNSDLSNNNNTQIKPKFIPANINVPINTPAGQVIVEQPAQNLAPQAPVSKPTPKGNTQVNNDAAYIASLSKRMTPEEMVASKAVSPNNQAFKAYLQSLAGNTNQMNVQQQQTVPVVAPVKNQMANPDARLEAAIQKDIANKEFANNMAAMQEDNSGYESGAMTQADKEAEFRQYLAGRNRTKVNDPVYMMINGDPHGDGGVFNSEKEYDADMEVAKARGLNPELVQRFRDELAQQNQ